MELDDELSEASGDGVAPRPLWLASASPRRRQLLEEAGIEAEVRPSDVDDGRLRCGAVPPRQWVVALAYLKGRRVYDALRDEPGSGSGIVLAADTACVVGDRILGKPRDRAAARDMLLAMRDREHTTMTGVCLIPLRSGRRHLFFDEAAVRVGTLPDDVVESYVASGEWRGKAGGYNLAERQAAGWPVVCRGDPTTVMGLPMRRLRRWLRLVESEP